MTSESWIDWGDLGRLVKIASGGQGTVYSAPDLHLPDCPGPLAYKEYFPGKVSAVGLEPIVGLRRRLSDEDRATLDSIAAWPCRVVKRDGSTVGVVMQLIGDRYFFNRVSRHTGESQRLLREVQYLLIDPDFARRLEVPVPDTGGRRTLCAKLAQALAFLHERDVVFGDISAKNELYFWAPGDESVMLVDCDAVRIKGQAAAVPQLNSPDWNPPGKEATTLNMRTDVYKFGLFVRRVLLPGPNGSTRRTTAEAASVLDADGMDLLRRSVDGPVVGRPSIGDWVSYLTGIPVTPAGGGATQGQQTSSIPAGAKWVRSTGGGWELVDGVSGAPVPVPPVAPLAGSAATPQADPTPMPPTQTLGPDHKGWERDSDGNWVPKK